MRSDTIARRYATAVFSLARKAGSIDPVRGELRAASETLFGSDGLRRFFLSPVFGRKEKEALIARAFVGKLGDVASHTLLLLVRKRREALLPGIVAELDKLALAAAGKQSLEIVSARALAPNELDDIVARLGRTYGTAFDVSSRVDPNLLGGVRITMGDRRIDGSLAGRIDDLARDLFARN